MVTITIPKARPPLSPAMRPTVALQILIVEPHDDVRYVFTVLLEMMGHTVRTARNVTEALDTVTESAPDMVLTELGLPERGATDLAKQLRLRYCSDDLTLVAITGDDRWSTEASALKAGFDHFLTKPVTKEEVTAVLQKIAEMKGRRGKRQLH